MKLLLAFLGVTLCASTLPDLPAQDHLGKQTRLHQITHGRPLALQFVFTDCPTSCPLLGALFQSIQKRFADLPADRGPLLLTVSVNPLRDTPSRLAAWRAKFSAASRWHALRLSPENLRTLQKLLGELGGPPNAHTTDLFLFDKSGLLQRRLSNLPSPDQVANALRELE
jgi:protein SCO1/2